MPSTLASPFFLFCLLCLGIKADEDLCLVGKLITGDLYSDETSAQVVYDDMVCRISASHNQDCTQFEFEMSIDKRKTAFCRRKGLADDVKISCDCVGELDPCNNPNLILSVLSTDPSEFSCLRKRLLENFAESPKDFVAEFFENDEKNKKLVATREETGFAPLLNLYTSGNIHLIMGPAMVTGFRLILPAIWIGCLVLSLYSLYLALKHWLPRFLQTY